ncbi:WXG100 family type VII secretion target [Streptomyces flavalbus]|uniref:Uncharacterized protein n=1 Tax=Streptomyces flavalbus TaxID=2665155 RepID=A0ABW2WHN3_9ACTN
MNMTRLFSPFGSSRGIHFGSTNFEGYDLNQMIDIVESANPELLETAGTALVDARDAINDAAEELSQNLGQIDWQGEAHTAFTDWGDSLIKTAQGIAAYADTIGTQVLAAGSGLASVRKSMPPRDNRTDPKSVDDIPEAKRVDSNDEYTAAVKAEAHRQEAINQMYRLASFYTVSAGTMQSAEEPVFPKMPDVGVPEPPPGFGPIKERPTTPASLTSVSETSASHQGPVTAAAERERPAEVLAPQQTADGNVTTPRQPVGTEIDSVGTLPSQDTVRPITVTPPPTTAPPATPPGPVPPMVPSATPPAIRQATGRTTRPGGINVPKVPPMAQGRTGAPPGPTSQTGRPGIGPTSQAGRVTPPAQAGGRRVGPVGPLGQPGRTVAPTPTGNRGAAPVQRGIVGGKPLPTGPVNGAARAPKGVVGAPPAAGRGGAGTGRAPNGVVGGRPVTGPTPGGNGSKLPRGTVVGAEGARGSSSTAQRPGQRGVIGTPPTTSGAAPTARRPTGGSHGVVGTPSGRTPRTANGGATDGAGTPRGAVGNRGSGTNRPRRDERRGEAPTTD